jgi:hypothetical protein
VTMTVCSNSLGYYERAGEGERRSDAVAGRAGVGGASWVDTCWVERESKGLDLSLGGNHSFHCPLWSNTP